MQPSAVLHVDIRRQPKSQTYTQNPMEAPASFFGVPQPGPPWTARPVPQDFNQSPICPHEALPSRFGIPHHGPPWSAWLVPHNFSQSPSWPHGSPGQLLWHLSPQTSLASLARCPGHFPMPNTTPMEALGGHFGIPCPGPPRPESPFLIINHHWKSPSWSSAPS